MSVSSGKAITVVIGRFEPLLGYGLKSVLSDEPHVRVLATDLRDVELESRILEEAPRVVIVGATVGYEVLLRLKALRPAVGVVVVASDPERLWGEMLVEAGVTCLAQNAPRRDTLAAVRFAAHGKPTHLPAGGGEAARVVTDVSPLTEREVDVFVGLSEGRTNREIAEALHLSARTVGTYVSMIFRKLDVHSRRQLIGVSFPYRDK